MLIKDILTIDLSQDLKHVIDLEDTTDTAIQSEIENYIITDGLAKEYDQFVNRFTSNINETGVWISGFYGSGKSYFGKLLGYLLSNKMINGTPARERLLNRFTGVTDEDLIKNNLASLDAVRCHVVFLNIAKQNTSKGLAFTLFRNFLRSLELPENEHGYLLYQMMINDNQCNIHDYIFQNLNKPWSDIKSHLLEYARAVKQIYISKGNTESDYNNILNTILREIDQFSAARFKDELANYINIVKDEKLVFIFDEASEALSQKKYTLLDLQGLSEALSDSLLSKMTWTIAIAQEKLDDVISNSNVSRANLTKVTDRFKTKIHLEATEVDVIIRNRLLTKTDEAKALLTDYYNDNSGKISDHAGLQATGIAKTKTLESFVTYYPFYKYQLNLLQNFLFGTKGYASTKVAARGMISTIYDSLKLELRNTPLYQMAAAWQIAREAQTAPPTRLANRYEAAETVLKESVSTISGRRLLETINFLFESEVVPTTLPNIVKAFIKEPEDFHKVKEEITKALNDLIEARLILYGNNTYRITSDLEQHMLDEQRNFTVQSYMKKKRLVAAYKNSQMVKTLARINDLSLQYDFYITTDSDDELTTPGLKYLKIKVKSIYNLSDDRTIDIETLKMQYQNDKDTIWLVPDNNDFNEINSLIDEIQRFEFLQGNYPNPQPDEAAILRDFSGANDEKENRLKDLVEISLQKATAIYLFNTYQLDKENWQTEMQKQQRQVIRNVYYKRLDSQLSDSVAATVIKEHDAGHLHTYFQGADFNFFDASGTFHGDNLKPADEILSKIKNSFVDGRTIEKELEQPPTGFTFGTVISTMAAIVRGGKAIVKYNGKDYFSWNNPDLREVFSVAAKFRNASFKAITKSLSPQQKNDMVSILRELKCDDHLSTKVNKVKIDWNTNDFELVQATRELAKHFCDKVDSMRKQNKDFNVLFGMAENHRDYLAGFTGVISDSNYMDKAILFLENSMNYKTSVQTVEKIEKFIGSSLPKLQLWKTFVDAVHDELGKAAASKDSLQQSINEFYRFYKGDVVKDFSQLQNMAQQVKDEYYTLMKNSAAQMATCYIPLKTGADALLKEIQTLPDVPQNQSASQKASIILQYAKQRSSGEVSIEYDVKDKITRFTWSEMLSFIDLAPTKQLELDNLGANLIRKVGSVITPETKLIKAKLPGRKIKVGQYKMWLNEELQKLSDFNDNDDVEISQ